MAARWITGLAASCAATLLAAPSGSAQPAVPPEASSVQPAPAAAQLDQLVAPIALYPDPLLANVLMAATYPAEVVEAVRWLQDPQNASLQGDGLLAALDTLPWDPSVKSLAAFPRVLRMMDGNLEWTESLGEAFAAEPGAVMEAVQRLRRQALAAGRLASNAEMVVSDEDGSIIIAPATPATVYVPAYNPSVIYGPWPYPDYPPFYFPAAFADCVDWEFGYCWIGVPIFLPLWGWNHWDWRHHEITIDRDRFGRLSGGRAPSETVWRHEPAHRLGAPYQTPAARQRFPGLAEPPAADAVHRGYPERGQPRTAPAARAAPNAPRPTPATPTAPARPLRPAPAAAPRVPPAFESFGRGDQVRNEAARGQASRMTIPSYTPRMTVPRSAPSIPRGGFGGRPMGGGR